jgi:hypothetical protein
LQTITDDLRAILKSKFQAAADGLRARVEVDVPGGSVVTPFTGTTLLAYGAAWAKLQGAHGHSAGFEAPGFEASGWASADAPFGSSGACSYVFTTGWTADTDLCLRAEIEVPEGASTLDFIYGVDNNASVYLDGTLIHSVTHGGCAARTNQHVSVAAPAPGTHLIAVRAVDVGLVTYFDMEITADGVVTTTAIETITYQVMRVSIDHSLQTDADAFEVELDNSDGSLNLSNPDSIALPGKRIRIFQWYGDPANEVQVFDGFIDKVAQHG